MTSLSKSTRSMNDQHHLHSRKYRQQKTRHYRYHPYTKPATTSSSTRTLQNWDSTPTTILPMVVRNTKTMRSTFEKREETQSISLGTPINDPEPSINEKMRTKSDLDDHHLQLHFSIQSQLFFEKDGSHLSAQKYFSPFDPEEFEDLDF
jgi:hypothetical protein